jgi:hypothetical protein
MEQRPPAAAKIQQPAAGADPNPLGHVLVLSPLRVLQRERKIAVILRAAEIGQLAEAEPEEAINQ